MRLRHDRTVDLRSFFIKFLLQPEIDQIIHLYPALGSLLSISLSNSCRTGTVQVNSNSASGASESNSVKSCVSQNSPIFSSESAFEMLLSLFSSIAFAFTVAHVASAADNGNDVSKDLLFGLCEGGDALLVE
jgi:hypothetical protein